MSSPFHPENTRVTDIEAKIDFSVNFLNCSRFRVKFAKLSFDVDVSELVSFIPSRHDHPTIE